MHVSAGEEAGSVQEAHRRVHREHRILTERLDDTGAIRPEHPHHQHPLAPEEQRHDVDHAAPDRAGNLACHPLPA
jgi:hypothetical protein